MAWKGRISGNECDVDGRVVNVGACNVESEKHSWRDIEDDVENYKHNSIYTTNTCISPEHYYEYEKSSIIRESEEVTL